jgi:hypothetical protein
MSFFPLFSAWFAVDILLATYAHGVHVDPNDIMKTIEVISFSFLA